MSYHFFAMFLGFVLDLLFGDPHWLPHPIRLIGNLIASLEKLNKKELSDTKKFLRGFAMVVIVIAWTTGVAAVILEGAYWLHPAIGCAVEAIMTYQILATKCLKVESMKVYEQLQKQNLPAARKAVSMIVGRDTEQLDETGVAKADNGCGTLTVKNGKMTIHIRLVSKKIVNLFLGSAKDAEKDGAKLLQPTNDTVKYSDGTTEEVYGFDVPVEALDKEFDLAILGTKGTWYDHKVSVSDAQKK